MGTFVDVVVTVTLLTIVVGDVIVVVVVVVGIIVVVVVVVVVGLRLITDCGELRATLTVDPLPRPPSPAVTLLQLACLTHSLPCAWLLLLPVSC